MYLQQGVILIHSPPCQPYLAIPCSLGEGPHYNATRNELRFLDINQSKLHVVNLTQGPSSLRTIDTQMPIGVTADIAGVDPSTCFLCGAKDGVTKFYLPDENTDGANSQQVGRHEYVAKYWAGLSDAEAEDKTRRFRSNDGNVDSRGRFWVEAFGDPEIEEPGKEGLLMRLDAGGKLVRVVEGVTIPNGLSWTADGKGMYFTDSPPREVYHFDYDEASGEIGNNSRRVFWKGEEEGVFPDGHALDVQGNVWHALYGGSRVVRISPRGEITGVVHLPTRNVTCPVFVGTQLFITTAKDQGEGDELATSRKFAGNLFRVDVGVEGVPKREVSVL
jgi:sugar lactone lactonase YvrE